MSRTQTKARSGTGSKEMLTVAEVCSELRISRSTWDRMMRLNEVPRFKRMGGKRGEIRVRREWLDEWLEGDAG